MFFLMQQPVGLLTGVKVVNMKSHMAQNSVILGTSNGIPIFRGQP